MSGVEIVGALLHRNAALIQRVPADRIKAGMLPDGVRLPALLVRSISRTERQKLVRSGAVRVTERVAVTVRAANYRDLKDIIKLVLASSAGVTGDVAGMANVAVLPAGRGPDVIGPASSFEQTEDFRVGFDEPA